jgi:hypothetical protein
MPWALDGPKLLDKSLMAFNVAYDLGKQKNFLKLHIFEHYWFSLVEKNEFIPC